MKRYADRDDRSSTLYLVPQWLNWAAQLDPIGQYLATWIAFNAIYVAEYRCPFAKFKEKNGCIEFVNRYEYGLKMARTDTVSERDMVQHVVKALPPVEKRRLVMLPSPSDGLDYTCLAFFASRTPVWQAIQLAQDKRGQPINGVVNVRGTINKDYPQWIPVDEDALDEFLHQAETDDALEVPEQLIEQVGDILYTVRNNLFHGCKGPEDSNDWLVVEHALAMLKVVVAFYAQ
jgi:hypothetical protein